MPYIITTGKPKGRPFARAVAALDEAREAASAFVQERMDSFGDDREALQRYGFTEAEDAALDLSEDGAQIKMSDGCVIEVRPVTWRWLALESRIPGSADGADEFTTDEQRTIIDAYNSKEDA